MMRTICMKRIITVGLLRCCKESNITWLGPFLPGPVIDRYSCSHRTVDPKLVLCTARLVAVRAVPVAGGSSLGV